MKVDNFSTRVVFCHLTLVLVIFAAAYCNGQAIEKLHQNERTADKLFLEGSYRAAMDIYEELIRNGNSDNPLFVKVARTHYRMREYSGCTLWYAKASRGADLSDEDTFNYAECLCASGNYKEGATHFKKFAARHKDDELVQNKIWRLNNIKFLYEDSAHYGVTKLSLNTTSSEMNAVAFGDGVVFVSDRSSHAVVKNVSVATGNEFYKMYYNSIDESTSNDRSTRKVEKSFRLVQSRFHNGGFCFYGNQTKLIMARTADQPSPQGRYSMQLFFATRSSDEWTVQSRFPHNNTDYNLNDPWINEDGTILYFTSDMKGGLGGLDIYKSELVNGHWTRPINLGEPINTRMDEKSPFISETGTLYFASDGHAGLGGFDIYRIEAGENSEAQVINMGFPINTSADDFAFRHNDKTSTGYLTSSRAAGNDDVYQVMTDQQIYPLVINGVLRTKESSWNQDSELNFLPGASLFLIDHTRNTVADETKSDASGNFSLNIPYFSLYKIRVVQPDGTEAIVSLELPRQKKKDLHHDIVVVRDAFKTQGQ